MLDHAPQIVHTSTSRGLATLTASAHPLGDVAVARVAVQWEPWQVGDALEEYLSEWGAERAQSGRINTNTPSEWGDQLWFADSGRLLVHGNAVVDVQQAVRGNRQCVVARLPQRVVEAHSGMAVDSDAHICVFE